MHIVGIITHIKRKKRVEWQEQKKTIRVEEEEEKEFSAF